MEISTWRVKSAARDRKIGCYQLNIEHFAWEDLFHFDGSVLIMDPKALYSP